MRKLITASHLLHVNFTCYMFLGETGFLVNFLV